MSPADVSPPRRPLLVPVLLATVFLSIIGAVAGLVLARIAPEEARATDPGAVGVDSSSGPDPSADSGRCREETQEQGRRAGAAGTLHVEQELQTATSTVWVCSDDAGRLYYHANRKRPDGAWIEGETAIFLTGVVRADGGYQAETVDGNGLRTIFFVTPQRLVIRHKDGRKEVQEAVGG